MCHCQSNLQSEIICELNLGCFILKIALFQVKAETVFFFPGIHFVGFGGGVDVLDFGGVDA